MAEKPMTTEQLVESLRALAEARAAGVVDETARIRFENACINTNFPALLEAVQGLVEDAERYQHIKGHVQMHPKMDGQHSWRVTSQAVRATGNTFDEAVDKSIAWHAEEAVKLRACYPNWPDLTSKPHGNKSQEGVKK